MPKPSDPVRLGDYKVFIGALVGIFAVMAFLAFGPHAEWKCPAGTGLVSGMCVPGAVPPVRQ